MKNKELITVFRNGKPKDIPYAEIFKEPWYDRINSKKVHGSCFVLSFLCLFFSSVMAIATGNSNWMFGWTFCLFIAIFPDILLCIQWMFKQD